MNRTIKFRAWDKGHNFMVAVEKLELDFKGNLIGIQVRYPENTAPQKQWYQKAHPEWPLDYIELMQFTGLLDKNGKEIYEGDILKHQNGSFGEIYYNTNRMRFGYRGGWSHPIESYPAPNEAEVIGNIYENPELIKQ